MLTGSLTALFRYRSFIIHSFSRTVFLCATTYVPCLIKEDYHRDSDPRYPCSLVDRFVQVSLAHKHFRHGCRGPFSTESTYLTHPHIPPHATPLASLLHGLRGNQVQKVTSIGYYFTLTKLFPITCVFVRVWYCVHVAKVFVHTIYPDPIIYHCRIFVRVWHCVHVAKVFVDFLLTLAPRHVPGLFSDFSPMCVQPLLHFSASY